jgi:membrane fusion protein (multidrug efflux system)
MAASGAVIEAPARTSPVARETTPVPPRDAVAPPPQGARKTRKRLLLCGAALLIAAGAVWYGHNWWTVGRFFESTDDAYVGADVTVMAPKVAGFIATVAVTDNQTVKAGDLLVKIDDRDYRAALAKADAAVAKEQATIANLQATRELQRAMIAQAEANVAGADAELVRSRLNQERFRQLAATSAASVESFQRTDADYKQAMAAGQRTRAAVDAAQRQLAVIDTQTDQARASLASALADRDTARLNLSYTEIRAPIDGVIGNRSARVGAYATVGAQVLSVVPAAGLWVDANFKENQLAHMHPGLPVTVEADVLPGQVFHGRVLSLAPATGAQFSVLPAENATGNFTKIVQRVPVRIALDDEGARFGRLRPGLSVTVDVDERPARTP